MQLPEEKLTENLIAHEEEKCLELMNLYTFKDPFLEGKISEIISLDFSRLFQYILDHYRFSAKRYDWVSQAIDHGSVKILSILLKNGADMEKYDRILKDVTVYWASAARSGKKEMVDFIINQQKNDIHSIKSIFTNAIDNQKYDMAKYIKKKYYPSPDLQTLLSPIFYAKNCFEKLQFYDEMEFLSSDISGSFIYRLLDSYIYGKDLSEYVNNLIKSSKFLFTKYTPREFDWTTYVNKLKWTEIEYLRFLVPFIDQMPDRNGILQNFIKKQTSLGNFAFVEEVEAKYQITSQDSEELLFKAIQNQKSDRIDLYLSRVELTKERVQKILSALIRTPNLTYVKKIISGRNDLTDFLPKLLKQSIWGKHRTNSIYVASLIRDFTNFPDLVSLALLQYDVKLVEYLVLHDAPISQIQKKDIGSLIYANRPALITALFQKHFDWRMHPSELLYIAVDSLAPKVISIFLEQFTFTQEELSHCLDHLLHIERNYDDVTPYGMQSPEVFYLSMNFHKQDPNDTEYHPTLQLLVDAGANLDLFTQNEMNKLIKRKLWRSVQYLLKIKTDWNFDLFKLLETAFELSQDKIISLLLEYGNFNPRENTKACCIALKWKNSKWISFFQERRLDIHYEHYGGNLLLSQAILSENIAFVQYILDAGIKANNFKLSEASWRIISQNTPLILLLKTHGFQLMIPNDNSGEKILL